MSHNIDSSLKQNHESIKNSHESRIREEVNRHSENINNQNHTHESLRKHIDSIAKPAEFKHNQHHERHHHYITKDVKVAVYLHTLKNARQHLKPSERIFSKIIHNNIVESISEAGSKTIARPGSIIGGGIFMIIGGISLFIIARYYGFYLPLSALLALYLLGFLAIFIVDLLKTLFIKIRR